MIPILLEVFVVVVVVVATYWQLDVLLLEYLRPSFNSPNFRSFTQF